MPQNNLINQQFSPYFSSIHDDPAQDTEQDRLGLTKQFLSLPKTVRYGVVSSEIEDAIRRVSNKYNVIDPKLIGAISRMVRNYYIFNETKDKRQSIIQQSFRFDQSKQTQFLLEIEELISQVSQIGEKSLLQSIEILPIIPALKKFEELGNQEITENWIEIEISENKEMVTPSTKNWLEDYIQNMGAQAHENLQRSEYLYKSKNTEMLSTSEREKLSIILRSYDKDEVLAIDNESQEALFDDSLILIEKIRSKSNASVVAKSDNGLGKNSIELTSSEHKESDSKKNEDKNTGSQELSQKTHEIGWYGTSPFNSLEKIRETGNENKSKNQPNNGDMQNKFGQQRTKHVVDLKN